MSKHQDYVRELGLTPDRIAFLRRHSGLPGPRGNLELVQAAAWAVMAVDRVTESVAAKERRSDEFRTLRQALGYCWSVVVVADPELGKSRFQRWASSADPDARWIVKENLKKTRLLRLDRPWADGLNATVSGAPV
jgi:hypothetical protein